MRRVLLTGFEPFGTVEGNASWEAVAIAAEQALPDLEVAAVRLPVTFAGAPAALEAAVERVDPDLVIAVGQAEGRRAVTLERFAVNLVSAPIPDNEGRRPVGEALVADGPDAYVTNLPVGACVAAVREAGVPAAESLTAGSYVCNAVFYRLMHMAATRGRPLLGGFVHVPLMPWQALEGDRPTVPAELSAAALRAIALTAFGAERVDATAGALH